MRIIAGKAGGVPLRAPLAGTRPTTDRVREAVFSALADWAGSGGAPADRQLGGCSFLDLFAGSGAVALEAASRGASPVVAVDSAVAAVRIARDNATASGLAVTVRRARVADLLAKPDQRFDIVWLDPPYELPERALAAVLEAVVDRRWLKEDGLVVVERSSRTPDPAWPAGLASTWCKRYGETVVHFATTRPTINRERP